MGTSNPSLVLGAGLALHLLGVTALVILAAGRLRAVEQPRGCAAALVPFWGVVAVYVGFVGSGIGEALFGPGEAADASGVAVSLAGGLLGGFLGWKLVSTLSHSKRTTGTPQGQGVPAKPGEPACPGHGNAASGTCDRCGDFVCPACTFPARQGPGKFCARCAERFEGDATVPSL